KIRGALLKGDSQAKGVWSKLCETVAFFERHQEWQALRPQGILAVVSDFRGANAFMTGEVLNLLNRRRVQFLVMERSRSQAGPPVGLKAILWLDKDAPGTEQLSTMLAFVRQGGLVIAQAYWGPSGVTPIKKDPSLQFEMYNIGQGQIAVAEK